MALVVFADCVFETGDWHEKYRRAPASVPEHNHQEGPIAPESTLIVSVAASGSNTATVTYFNSLTGLPFGEDAIGETGSTFRVPIPAAQTKNAAPTQRPLYLLRELISPKRPFREVLPRPRQFRAFLRRVS